MARMISCRCLVAQGLTVSALALCMAMPARAASGFTPEERRQRLEAVLAEMRYQAELQGLEIQRLKRQAAADAQRIAQRPQGDLIASDHVDGDAPGGISFSLSGQLNRGLLTAFSDGSKFSAPIDHTASPSRLTLEGNAGSPASLRIGGKLEVAIASNGGGSVGFDDQDKSDRLSLRYADTVFQNAMLGTIKIGQGDMAAEGTSESDNSGTASALWAGVQHIGGGLQFDGEPTYYERNQSVTFTRPVGSAVTVSTGVMRYPSVSDVMNHYDGVRADRLRYETPAFYGVSVAAAVAENRMWDTSINYKNKVKGFDIDGSIAYFDNTEDERKNIGGALRGTTSTSLGIPAAVQDAAITRSSTLNGSVSVKTPWGVTITGTAATRFLRYNNLARTDGRMLLSNEELRAINDRDDWFGYLKLSYAADIFPFGMTLFAVDAAYANERRQTDEYATAFGIGVVQQLPQYGSELYFSFRRYDIHMPEHDSLSDGGSRTWAINNYVSSTRSIGAEDFQSGNAGGKSPTGINVFLSGIKVKF